MEQKLAASIVFSSFNPLLEALRGKNSEKQTSDHLRAYSRLCEKDLNDHVT